MGESLTNLLTEQGGLRTAYVTQTGNKTAKPLSVGAFLFLAPRSLTIWMQDKKFHERRKDAWYCHQASDSEPPQ